MLFFKKHFVALVKRSFPEPRVGILFVFSIRGHGLPHDLSACVVLLDSQMLFIWFGVKNKSHLVLFVTSAILAKQRGFGKK